DTVAQSGQFMTLDWKLDSLDTYIYDSVSALVYCMDYTGPDQYIWREISTLFKNNMLVYPTGRYTFRLPNCGPLAEAGAVRMIAEGYGGSVQGEDACYFAVQPMSITPFMPVQPSPITTTAKTTTTNVPVPPPSSSTGVSTSPESARLTIGSNPTSTLNPIQRTIPPTTSPNPPNSPSPNPQNTPSPNPSPLVDPVPGTSAKGTTGTTAAGGGGGGGGGVPPVVQTHPPFPPLPSSIPHPETPPTGPTSEKSDNSSVLKTTLLSVGIFTGLAAVVVPLLVMRHRRMRRSRQRSGGEEAVAGPGRGVMKEARRRRGSQPKEGYFYQMEDHDDDEDDDNDSNLHGSGDLEKRYAAAAMAEGQDRSLGVGAGIGQLDTVSVPQMAYIGDSAAGGGTPYHKRRSSLPYMVTSSYTMSSMGGSSVDEDSSVVRKYWAASMAARAERRLEGHSPTRGLDDESDVYGYDEGSIFGDQSRDSDSRMADILSLRTTGSADGTTGGTMDTRRHHLYDQHHRRDTLSTSFGGASSYISTRTMTPTSISSSGFDSCPFSEEEFLERMHIQQLQAQLQQEYYTQQQRDQRYYESSSSMMSRRTSSVPSLTSTNDPFKTFDSNEILLDQRDPFADPDPDHHRTPSPLPLYSLPSLQVPPTAALQISTDRSNSDLFRSFPPTP
ncbi:hypothetical protein BGX23_011637, partial [Mortierella sp. AD031]